MTLLSIAIGLGTVTALGLGVLGIALCRAAARRDAIADQQRRHPHPSTFDTHADQALAIANSDRTGYVICDSCSLEQTGRPFTGVGISGPAGAEASHYVWDCAHCRHRNYFAVTVQPTTPRSGK